MRRAARVDSNQASIVKVLRQMGCTVQPLHTIGRGCPDILVGKQGLNLLMELKDGQLPPSGRKLTEDEIHWHADWRGQVSIVESEAEAIRIINRIMRPL